LPRIEITKPKYALAGYSFRNDKISETKDFLLIINFQWVQSQRRKPTKQQGKLADIPTFHNGTSFKARLRTSTNVRSHCGDAQDLQPLPNDIFCRKHIIVDALFMVLSRGHTEEDSNQELVFSAATPLRRAGKICNWIFVQFSRT
jgi:hypothetical protein